MANRNYEVLKTLGKRRAVIAGSFAPNGSSAISAAGNKGRGFTVARTGTGTYTITLSEAWSQCDAAVASLQLATADDKFVTVGPIDMSAKTIVIYAWDISGGALADVAADANNRINFILVLRNSSIEY